MVIIEDTLDKDRVKMIESYLLHQKRQAQLEKSA